MNNLVIGNTSQLAYYFPKEYEKISSRNISRYYDRKFPYFQDKFYDRVFLCFAEQRTFLKDETQIFFDINVDYTLEVLNFFKDKCNKIIVYGTAELWNYHQGPISIEDEFSYYNTPYIESKEEMCKRIYELRSQENLSNVIILHPVNFNSISRKDGFLFSKIFDSIINKKKIQIGNTYFYRDLVHPKYVVERSILSQEDEIIGSGRLTHVNDFIRDLYRNKFMDYDEYVTENFDYSLSNNRKIYYLKSKMCLYPYSSLFKDTYNEL